MNKISVMKTAMIVILLAGLLFLLATMPSTHARAGDLADVSIRLSDGTLARLIVPPCGARVVHDGVPVNRRYAVIPESRDRDYTVIISSKAVPISATVIVDGHNSLTGNRVSDFTSKANAGRAYVFARRGTYAIEGWRETSTAVRRFRVTEGWKSLSWELSGDMADAGTIAISVFRQKRDTQPEEIRPDRYFGRLGTDAGERIHRPIQVVSFVSEAKASEIFALRLIRERDVALLQPQRVFDVPDEGFIGPLP